MKPRYVLSPEAAADLIEIWRYIKQQSSLEVANHVESVIRDRIAFLSRTPGAGHSRSDLTDERVRFFPAYSYLMVYRPKLSPCRSSASSTVAVIWNESWPTASEFRRSLPAVPRLSAVSPRLRVPRHFSAISMVMFWL